MYRISQIKLGPEDDIGNIPKLICKKIGKPNIKIDDFQIVKESIDARDKRNIKLVYTVDFYTKSDLTKLVGKFNIEKVEKYRYTAPKGDFKKMKHPPVIVGFGPCGMYAALILAEMGFKPLVLERGKRIEERVEDVDIFWKEKRLNPESNVQFGEGGAGTFSDGKLTTQIKDERIRKVLEEFVLAGAPDDILYKQKPHIGTDILRPVVTNIREKIENLGGKVRFSAKVTDFSFEALQEEKNREKELKKRIKAVQINDEEWIETDDLILSIGHSARDTFRILHKCGITMNQKPFSMGVRIEHPQKMIDKSQYGKTIEKLGAASYKLSHRCENGRGVYTFCMCPGGEVINASSQEGRVVVNGMSYHHRAGEFGNSALLVDVRTSDFPSEDDLAGVLFQEYWEEQAFIQGGKTYDPPKALWGEFRDYSNAKGAAVRNSLPGFIVEAIIEAMPELGKKLKGFDSEESRLTAIEARSSSPVRILRDENFESNISGMYPAGEGAGYAGGITSAAVDGIRIAEKLLTKYGN